MTKQQAEHYYNVKELNKTIRDHGLAHRCKVQKDYCNDYKLVWDYDASNLPEKIAAQRAVSVILAERAKAQRDAILAMEHQ